MGEFSLPPDKELQRQSLYTPPETDKRLLHGVTSDWSFERNLDESKSRLPFMPSTAAYRHSFTLVCSTVSAFSFSFVHLAVAGQCRHEKPQRGLARVSQRSTSTITDQMWSG